MTRLLTASLAAAALAGGVAAAISLQPAPAAEASKVCAGQVTSHVLGQRLPDLPVEHTCVGPNKPGADRAAVATKSCVSEIAAEVTGRPVPGLQNRRICIGIRPKTS